MGRGFVFLLMIPAVVSIAFFSSCGKDRLSAENLIETVDNYRTELLKTSSLTDFVEAEKKANDDLARFKSSTEPLDQAEVDPLVTAILSFNRQTYLHRLSLEGRTQSASDAELLNESLDDMEIAMKIQAGKSATVGEFLTAISGG